MISILYFLVAAIWGSTWLAISFQSAEAPVLTSIFYRFLIATVCLGIIAVYKNKIRMLRGRDLYFSMLQGVCLYSLNYICFYNGVKYISGGMESLIFSTAIFFNSLNGRLFYRESAPKGFFISALIGTAGLILILSDELYLNAQDSWKGIAFCFAGTILFSLGNMIGRRQHNAKITVVRANFYSMMWGTALLALMILLSGAGFAAPATARYILPLIYLAVPGSVIAFTAYLTLVNKIGAQKASFVTVVSPLIAMALAILFEGERLTAAKGIGAILILLGNRLINFKLHQPSLRPIIKGGENNEDN